jgi:hypothetical protein
VTVEENLSRRLRILFLAVVLPAAPISLAQGHFQVLSGIRLRRAIPRDFYLEGTALPVEKRNAVLIEAPSGARLLFALVVTSGWASQLPHKYSGMVISEGSLSVCGNPLPVGSYGFGLHRPAVPARGKAEFVLYNQAGQSMWQCSASEDVHLKQPQPLRVMVADPHSVRLYLGRNWVELRP